MLGGKNKQPLGYTIIEVMIVLAISGLMFIIATQFINGKQERASFNESVTDLSSQIQNTIEQVTDGNYTDVPIRCTESGAAPLNITTPGPGSNVTQGTNSGCIFYGKVIHFNTPTSYEVFSLAACRSACGGSGPTTARPTPLVDFGANGADLTVHQLTPENLTVKSLTIIPADGSVGSTNANNVAFIPTLGPEDSYTSETTGSDYTILAYADPATHGVLNDSLEKTAATDIIDQGVAKLNSATFCVTDGNQYAEISLGSTNADGGSTLNVSAKMEGPSGSATCSRIS